MLPLSDSFAQTSAPKLSTAKFSHFLNKNTLIFWMHLTDFKRAVTLFALSLNMVLKGFINIYSTTFPGLSNKIQGVHFLRHIFFCHSHANKRIPVSANNFRKTTDNSYSFSFPAQKIMFFLTQPRPSYSKLG